MGKICQEKVIKMNAELAARRDFTVEDIENLPDGVRAELIDGQIFYFASPRTIHQRLQMKLAYELYHYVDTTNWNFTSACTHFAGYFRGKYDILG